MRIIFAGTPAFGACALAKLLEAGHEVPLVLTQPDRPAGRGLKPLPGAVKQLCAARGLAVFQPGTLRDAGTVQRIASVHADVIVTAAYGLILPQPVLDLAAHGALNVHGSLLPRWRGAAPIQRALLAGDRESGATIIQMDAGLDTGAMLAQRAIPITEDDDAQSLHDRLAALGAELIVHVLDELAAGRARAQPQPASGVTYADKIRESDLQLDWSKPARQIERTVRALRPAPGAHTLLRGVRCKVWRVCMAEGNGDPGTVLAAEAAGIRVACGEGALEITELQRAGGRRLPAAEFLRGFPVATGERFAHPC